MSEGFYQKMRISMKEFKALLQSSQDLDSNLFTQTCKYPQTVPPSATAFCSIKGVAVTGSQQCVRQVMVALHCFY